MKKITTITLTMLLFVVAQLSATTGWYSDYVKLDVNGAGVTAPIGWFWIGTDPSYAAQLNSTNLGNVGTLTLKGADMKYWSDTQDRTGASFFYKVTNSAGNTTYITDTEVIMDQVALGGNDYQATKTVTVNLLNTIPQGTACKLVVYSKSWGTGQGDSWLSNGGANYVADFTYNPVTVTGANGIADGTGYATLGAAFTAINAQGTQAGKDIQVKLSGSSAESAQVGLTQPSVSSWNSLKIFPTVSGVQITGSFANALLYINGADNVTIDGAVNASGSTKDMVVHHTQAKGALAIQGDANNVTIKNCTFKGAPASLTNAVIQVTAGSTAGNDNVTITNNNITGGSGGRPTIGIYAAGVGAGNENDNLTITNNNIYDIMKGGLSLTAAIYIGTRNSGTVITGNSIYETTPVSITAAVAMTTYGITVGTTSGTPAGHTISNNYIGGTAPLCGGSAMTITATGAFTTPFYALYCNSTCASAVNIQGNTIQNIDYTGSVNGGDFAGIYIAQNATGTFNVGTTSGNTIGSSTGTGSLIFRDKKTAGGDNMVGIYSYFTNVAGASNYPDIENNSIGSMTAIGTDGTVPCNLYGIYKRSALLNATIKNNLIGSNATANSMQATGTSTAGAQVVYGINSSGAAATIENNTINNLTNACTNATTATVSVCQGINSTATAASTMNGNTVRNITNAASNKGTAGSSSVLGIFVTGAGDHTVSGNTINGISNTYTNYQGYLSGIEYNVSSTTTTNKVEKNFVYGLTVPNFSVANATSTTAAKIYGINIASQSGANSAVTIANNIVSIANNNDNIVYGINDASSVATETTKFYHNTVYVSGATSVATDQYSYCLNIGSAANTRDIRNNILYNNRTRLSGNGYNYCIYYSTSGNTNLTADNNDYWVPAANMGATYGAYLAKYSGSTTITTISALQTAAGKDAASRSSDPTFISNGSTTATDYKAATMVGDATTGISVDYSGTPRTANAYQIGAWDVPTAPTAPTINSITPGNAQLSVAFTAGDNGGQAITNYKYSTNGGSSFTACSPTQTTSPIVIGSLTNGTSYSVKILAVNSVGDGTASGASSGTPATTPGAPTVTSITAGDGQILVYFTAGNNGGYPITNYSYTLTGVNPYTTLNPVQATSPLTITGLTNGNTYSVRLRAINSVGAGVNSNLIAVTLPVLGSVNISSLTLTASNDVVVGNTGNLVVDATKTINNLTISSGSRVTLNSGVSLNVNGNMNINSDASNGTGTFVDAGGTLSVTGTVNVQQYLGTTRNWYISSPVSNAVMPSGYSYWKRNEAAVSWETINTGSAFDVGTGYVALPGSTLSTLTFSTQSGGTLNTGNKSVTLSYQGASKKGFNLIGNPYPSHLTWSQTFVDDVTNAALIEPTIWYRTNSGGSNTGGWSFSTYNASTGAAVPGGTTGVIPPMQAFWVKAKAAGTLSLDSKLVRSHQASNPLKAKSNLNADLTALRIQVSNGSSTDEALLYFNPNASNAYDRFDSPKMSNNIASMPEIYTVVGTEQLVINGLNSIVPDMEIPLGFTTGEANNFTIKASEISNINPEIRVILKDKLLNIEQELTIGNDYTFSSNIVSTTDRFSLVFRVASIVSNTSSSFDSKCFVYRNSYNQIVVKSEFDLNGGGLITVYNALGQKITDKQMTSSVNVIENRLNDGLYFVTVSNCGKYTTKRVIIN